MASAGRVLMIPVGEWVSGSDYGLLDVVSHLGSSYVARNAISNSTTAPDSDTINWQLIAQGYDTSNIVTKDMITSQNVNSTSTVPSSAALYSVYNQLNSDLGTYNATSITPTNLGMLLYYYRYGIVKSIYTAGTHTTTWAANTKYGLGTMGGVYLPNYGWSKRILYKSVEGIQYFAVLEMDVNGVLAITPENVTSGGIIRINETYF